MNLKMSGLVELSILISHNIYTNFATTAMVIFIPTLSVYILHLILLLGDINTSIANIYVAIIITGTKQIVELVCFY